MSNSIAGSLNEAGIWRLAAGVKMVVLFLLGGYHQTYDRAGVVMMSGYLRVYRCEIYRVGHCSIMVAFRQSYFTITEIISIFTI